MGTKTVDYFTLETLNDEIFDKAKVAVLEALINDGLIDKNKAEKWSIQHTVELRNNKFFRTISNYFRKKEKDGNFYFKLIKIALENEELEYLESLNKEE